MWLCKWLQEVSVLPRSRQRNPTQFSALSVLGKVQRPIRSLLSVMATEHELRDHFSRVNGITRYLILNEMRFFHVTEGLLPCD